LPYLAPAMLIFSSLNQILPESNPSEVIPSFRKKLPNFTHLTQFSLIFITQIHSLSNYTPIEDEIRFGGSNYRPRRG
jgi:hypothetical protein